MIDITIAPLIQELIKNQDIITSTTLIVCITLTLYGLFGLFTHYIFGTGVTIKVWKFHFLLKERKRSKWHRKTK